MPNPVNVKPHTLACDQDVLTEPRVPGENLHLLSLPSVTLRGLNQGTRGAGSGTRACGWTGGSGERRQGRGWWRKAPEGGGSRQHAPGPWHAGLNRWRRGRSPTGLRPHTILRRSLATIPGYSSTLTRIPLVYVNQVFRLKRVYGETFKPYVHDADQHTPGGPRCPLCLGPRRWPRSGTTAVPTSSLTSGSSCLSENFAHIERHGAVFWVRFPLPRTLSRCCGVSSSRN